MKENLKKIVTISLISLIPTLLLWLPFFFRFEKIWGIPLNSSGMATIVSNYDGPLYLVVAKTFYNKAAISANYQFPLPTEYYAAHFPFFPFLIRLVSVFVNSPYAMLTVTLVSSILALYFFNKLAEEFTDKKTALYLTFVFAIFPARWLIVRSVGSADPLFVGAIIASLYYFKKQQYLWAGIWGAIAQLTKSPGILLFASYFLCFLLPIIKRGVYAFKLNVFEKFNLKATYPLLLIPISLLGVFSIYYFLTGDFWAYFHSGDNIHLGFPPFQIFNYSSPWVGTSWIEEIIFFYLFGALAIFKLFKDKEYEIGSFVAVFFFFLLFVAHRDLLRYALPIVPFVIIAFRDFLAKNEFKIALGVVIIPIFLFSLGFLAQNAMPISNWAPFL